MDLVYDVVDSAASPAVIKVIGIGGGGCNAINNMIKNTIQGSRCQYVVYYNRHGWWYRYRCCSGCC